MRKNLYHGAITAGYVRIQLLSNHTHILAHTHTQLCHITPPQNLKNAWTSPPDTLLLVSTNQRGAP